MLKTIFTLLPAALLLALFPLPGSATLAGTAVDGSLTFAGDPSNYFDLGYGFIPAGNYLNASGTSVTISQGAIEFGFDDGASLISADFSNNGLTVSDLIEASGSSNSFRMTFTDLAFAGHYLSLVSDSFPLVDHYVLGKTITIDYGGGNPMMGQTLTANFTVAPVPEPATISTVAIAMMAALAVFFARGLRPKSL